MDFNKLQKMLLDARSKDLEAQDMGEMPSPTALGALAEAGAEHAGQRLDEVGKQQKTLSDQAWDRASSPMGPQLPDNTLEEIARSKELSSGVMGSMAPTSHYLPSTKLLDRIKDVAEDPIQYSKALMESKANTLDKYLGSENAMRARRGLPELKSHTELPEDIHSLINKHYSPYDVEKKSGGIIDEVNKKFKNTYNIPEDVKSDPQLFDWASRQTPETLRKTDFNKLKELLARARSSKISK